MAEKNPVRKRGRNSISRFAAVLSGPDGTFCGYNSYRSSDLQVEYAEKAGQRERLCEHAEVSAIAKAVQEGKVTDFTGYKMSVARLLKDGTPALAKPCSICSLAINEFNIKEVEYTE